MRIFTLLGLILLFSGLGYGQRTVRLVTDFTPGSDGFRNDMEIIGTIGNSIVFDDRGDVVLSNGFESGTSVIGNLGTDGRVLHNRVELNGKLYFHIVNDESDFSLIEIDPLLEQMRVVISGFANLSNLVSFRGSLYMGVDGSNFNEFFAKVDLNTGELETIFDVDSFGGIRDILVHNDLIYTIHWSDNRDGAFLASNDGTPGSLNEFFFFFSGSDFSSVATINMTSADDYFYFWYNNGSNPYMMFRSDGTDTGTIELTGELQRVNFFDFDANRSIGTIGNSIFFYANEIGSSFDYLWMSDGTAAGTQRVELEEDLETEPRFFTNYNDLLYFRGFHTSGSFSDIAGMIVTDGTADGTFRAWDVDNHNELENFEAWHLIEHQGLLYFNGPSETNGNELWQSDATLINTIRLSDIIPGEDDASPVNFRSAGENLFFLGRTPETGLELYVFGPESSSTENIITKVSLSPNPVSDRITFENLDTGTKDVIIYNMQGSIVSKTKTSENMVKVDGLQSGSYVLQLITNEVIYALQFIKL